MITKVREWVRENFITFEKYIPELFEGLDQVRYEHALLVGGALILTFVAFLLIRWRARRSLNVGVPDLNTLTRGSRITAFLVIGSFFGIGGAWSVLAPLDSAAIASGVVTPEGARRTVQHLEGGIIRELHVRDGDVVRSGDPLVTLADIRARADHQVIAERYLHLRVKAARLAAEQRMQNTLDVGGLSAGRLSGTRVTEVLASERGLLTSRWATLQAQEKVLGQRIRQLEEENRGLVEAIDGQNQQLDLIEQEISGVTELYDKGLALLPRLLALQRDRAQVQIDRAQNRARIARNEQRIGEAELEIARLQENWRERASNELTEVRAELAEVEGRLPEAQDALTRTVVVAPVSGTVVELAFSTDGGVIKAGERILDIVPVDADLLIDARVRPSDIDDVRRGQLATVVLSAYTQRNMPIIDGRVQQVSADRLVEERSGTAYYLAKVKVERDQIAALGEDVDLVPGMPADVMISTGSRTFFDYIVTPITRSFDRAFREPE
jgi:HlyD family secretion protein/epimerase transport system membrane fusion protein